MCIGELRISRFSLASSSPFFSITEKLGLDAHVRQLVGRPVGMVWRCPGSGQSLYDLTSLFLACIPKAGRLIQAIDQVHHQTQTLIIHPIVSAEHHPNRGNIVPVAPTAPLILASLAGCVIDASIALGEIEKRRRDKHEH